MYILTSDFSAVLPNEHYPKLFKAGEQCPESLLEVARKLRKIEPETVVEKAAKKVVTTAKKVRVAKAKA